MDGHAVEGVSSGLNVCSPGECRLRIHDKKTLTKTELVTLAERTGELLHVAWGRNTEEGSAHWRRIGALDSDLVDGEAV
eukprot:420477-Prorocentrum_lima.AAC.1